MIATHLIPLLLIVCLVLALGGILIGCNLIAGDTRLQRWCLDIGGGLLLVLLGYACYVTLP